MQAEILRVVYGPNGAIKPGEVVDISEWKQPNINALEAEGKIRVIGGTDDANLHVLETQNKYIKELETRLNGSSSKNSRKKLKKNRS